jgi:hypothetical protein
MARSSSKPVLWWVCLVAAPTVLIVIELFHPAGFTHDPGMYEYLSKPEAHTSAHHALDYFGPKWWFTLHMIQTPMVGLVAVGLWFMVDAGDAPAGVATSIAAWVSRIATFIFAVYYTALDAIGGIGLGRTIEITQDLVSAGHLSPDQLSGVILVLNTAWTDPWVGGEGSFISELGSWAVFVAALAAALALYLTKQAPLISLAALIAFGWFLQVSHASYTGPLAFALLIVSALSMWFAAKRRERRALPT